MPFLLIPIPFIELAEHNAEVAAKAKYVLVGEDKTADDDAAAPADEDGDGGFSFGDAFIHQAIHTIVRPFEMLCASPSHDYIPCVMGATFPLAGIRLGLYLEHGVLPTPLGPIACSLAARRAFQGHDSRRSGSQVWIARSLLRSGDVVRVCYVGGDFSSRSYGDGEFVVVSACSAPTVGGVPEQVLL